MQRDPSPVYLEGRLHAGSLEAASKKIHINWRSDGISGAISERKDSIDVLRGTPGRLLA
jgi:hypothetical protein